MNFEEVIRALNDVGYQGPLSVEWEDSGMDRDHGAKEACEFVRRMNFEPSKVAFDAAFDKEEQEEDEEVISPGWHAQGAAMGVVFRSTTPFAAQGVPPKPFLRARHPNAQDTSSLTRPLWYTWKEGARSPPGPSFPRNQQPLGDRNG